VKYVLVVVLVLACAVSACAGAEVRGAWVTSWDDGMFTPQQIDATIAAMKKAGLNALFLEVRKCADAYYDSKLEPKGKEVPAGFVPLAYAIQKCHPEGIQVHAWVVVYRAYSGSRTGPTDPNNIVNKHPDWVMISDSGRNYAGEGIYFDPGIPEARDYIISVFADIAKRYNIDGLQYDYVRYPGNRWGYSDGALKRYYADTGATTRPERNDPKWCQWRRDQVTELVKRTHDKVKAVNPKCQISASTICYGGTSNKWEENNPYVDVLQDWYLWMRQGWLDINIPMNYKSETSARQAEAFRKWIKLSEDWNGGRPVYQGIYSDENTPAGTIAQIQATRQGGQEGFVLFSFNEGKRRDALVEELSKALGPAPKLRVNEPVAAYQALQPAASKQVP